MFLTVRSSEGLIAVFGRPVRLRHTNSVIGVPNRTATEQAGKLWGHQCIGVHEFEPEPGRQSGDHRERCTLAGRAAPVQTECQWRERG